MSIFYSLDLMFLPRYLAPLILSTSAFQFLCFLAMSVRMLNVEAKVSSNNSPELVTLICDVQVIFLLLI